MRGIIVNCKTGKTDTIDDGLPMPDMVPDVELTGINLVEASQKLQEIDHLKARVDALEAAQPKN